MANNIPNLRQIQVTKQEDFNCTSGERYSKVGVSAIDKACNRLTTIGAIKLYLYFIKNQNGYTLDLYSSTFAEWGNLGRTAYRTGFNELIDKGYLVENRKNEYIFYDIPQQDDTPVKVTINKTLEEFEF